VQLLFGLNDAILRNSIHSNGGLGIDLTPVTGVTLNDAEDADAGGANDLQNFPTLTRAVASATFTTVEGFLHSTPNSQFVVDFFSNDACDPSGNGEGQTWIATRNVTTGINGTAAFVQVVPFALPTTAQVTSTAMGISGGTQNSSEFSNCIAVALSGGGFEAPVELFASASMLSGTSRPGGRPTVRERSRQGDPADELVPPLFDSAAAAPLALLLLAGAVGARTRSRKSRPAEAA
jgi:hypothetical protein